MKRKTLLIVSLVRLLLLSSLVQAEQIRPNVVLIMADDVSWEAFGCYGAVDYATPHIDKLAAEGVRFSHCYSTPICTPSRVMIMTGKYNYRNYTHFGYLSPNEKTFGHLFQNAGYETMIAGKWQLNGLYDEHPDCRDNTRVYQAGFDEFALWQVTKGKLKRDGGGERFWSPYLEINGKLIAKEENEGQYGPDIMSDHICDFIERNQDKPFFVYYPTVLVHSPFVPTPDSIGNRSRGHEMNRQPKDSAEIKANFVAMVRYMDKIIGKITAKLDEVGQLENTLIIFTSDNGTSGSITSNWNGMQIQGGKGGLTNAGTHVPLVVYWKGKTATNHVVDDLINFTDIYPTIAEAAGIPLSEDNIIDGISFLPQLKGETGTPRKWVANHYQSYWSQKLGAWTRTQDYKLYHDGRFFNVSKDILEEENLEEGLSSERIMSAHQMLQAALAELPPVSGVDAPAGQKMRELKERPLHPDWEKLKDFD